MIVWLASYPRSGNTYLRTILSNCFGISTYSLYDDPHDIASDSKTSELVGHVSHGRSAEEFLAYARKSTQTYFIKTHELPSDNSKAIYVIRDGLATSVSYRHYLENFGTTKKLCDVILGNVDFGAWDRHVRSWLARPEDTLFLRYEEITSKLDEAVEDIANFLGIYPKHNGVPSFAELKSTNPVFFRSGSNQKNIGEVDKEDKIIFQMIAGELNQKLGYQPHCALQGSILAIASRLAPAIHLLQDENNALEVRLKETALQSSAIDADRTSKGEVIERLMGEMAAVEADRAAKATVVDRLLSERNQLAQALDAIDADRTSKGEVIERLMGEMAAVEADRAAKATVVDRLLSERDQLAQVLDAMDADRKALVEKVDQGRQIIERLSDEQTNLAQKLSAKEKVIENLAIRDLERKALLRGTADLLYHVRRQHVPPSYGDYFPPESKSVGQHVAIDTLEIVFGVSGGVETYMKMLASALIEGKKQVTLICLPDQLPALRRQFQSRVGYFVMRQSSAIALSIELSKRVPGRAKRLSAATSMATFARLREHIGADVLHSPVQIFSTLDFRVPSVLNLHDLQHLHFPENFRPSDIEARNRLYGLSASLADAIVVSSDFVRNDLIEKMSVPASKVFTVPVTWDPLVISGLQNFGVEQAIALYKLPPLYAIYPAQFWPHKNHVRLVEALRIVRDKRPSIDLKLVFTGYRGHTGWPKVQETITAKGLENDVVCLDHVPVEHLAAIYRGAVFCVMPSTFEASSYPVIESQVLGVPAMCSNVTSLPELMRDGAGLLFDPFDPTDIAAKMLRWLSDPEDRQAHAERAYKKALFEHSLQNYITGLDRAYSFAVETRSLCLQPVPR